MMGEHWVVEIDCGAINWTVIAHCTSQKQAEHLAVAPHIVAFGKPARARRYGTKAPLREEREPRL